MTVNKDGSFNINLPNDSFEMLDGLRLIYKALLDYAGELPSRKRMVFVLSEHFAHEDFQQKLLQGEIKDALLPKPSILQ